MSHQALVALAIVLTGLWGAPTATAAAPDLSHLEPPARAVFSRVAAEEFCACNSPMTLAGCLELRPDCRMGQHLSQVILRGIEAGQSADQLLGFLSERVLGPMCDKAVTIDVNGAPAFGPANAPITVVEFADFRCSHCQRMAPLVHEAVERWGKRVRFYFLPFPIQDHPLSIAAAEALLAADAQGKGMAMLNALFAHAEDDFEHDKLLAVAKEVRLDLPKFEKELASHRHRAKIASFKQAGAQAGVDGTPAFFVNGRRFDVDMVLFNFADRFEMELDRNHGSCQ